MKEALIFSLKVWLTAVVFGPPVIVVLTKLIEPHSAVFDSVSNVFGSIGLLIYLGLFASLPSYLLLWLATFLLVKYKPNVAYNRIILSAIAIVFSVLPFYLIFGHDDNPREEDLGIWVTSYTLIIILGVWLYKLQPLNRKREIGNQY